MTEQDNAQVVEQDIARRAELLIAFARILVASNLFTQEQVFALTRETLYAI